MEVGTVFIVSCYNNPSAAVIVMNAQKLQRASMEAAQNAYAQTVRKEERLSAGVPE